MYLWINKNIVSINNPSKLNSNPLKLNDAHANWVNVHLNQVAQKIELKDILYKEMYVQIHLFVWTIRDFFEDEGEDK